MPTVFVDIDTQLDFLYPAGALYVPGAENIVPAIERLNRHAAAHGIPVISTTDAHAENDPEFTAWPPHCVAGTIGQHKPAGTLLEPRVVVPNSDDPLSIEGARQILLEKQTTDAFQTRTLDRILEALRADRFVVYGVVTEICVLAAARGLLKRGKQVVLLPDAVRALNEEKAGAAIEEVRRLGGQIAPIPDVLAG
ncbi:MAG TPA: isochorismatase family cysteine hydrolase [Bryobacteraceae bacterium]|nr:isochorismatase family cysteine hydrolase [Bryobacteraceae bacterium]